MKFRSFGNGIRIVLAVLVSGSAACTVCHAQAAGSATTAPATDAQAKPAAPPAPIKINPQEQAAYKAFYAIPSQQGDAKIQAGQAFIQKYPMSRYVESVYAAFVQVYYDGQDWKNFYDYADKTLALNPDEVSVLATVGWVIPHVYDENDPNAAKDLDKAERYEKHAIELIPTMPKPAGLTDAQFAQSKTDLLSQAHSGLGLVYFREKKSDPSVTELLLSTQGAVNPDPTDLYVLALGLQDLGRNKEAADAYNSCAQIPGGLQGICKQGAVDAAKKAGPAK